MNRDTFKIASTYDGHLSLKVVRQICMAAKPISYERESSRVVRNLDQGWQGNWDQRKGHDTAGVRYPKNN
jgi:hypothetical protein